ncbi:unnamed protein product [Brachionus calyciflorus]|uniref:Uncharacterized protein n=1 Tax=Brachionus calyciflorus TaxID=104777 RepID=A0A813UHH1_9BILA|nr:unnamed protein product [Brachionus calyciflorus]
MKTLSIEDAELRNTVKTGIYSISLRTVFTSSLLGYGTFLFSRRHNLDKTIFPYLPFLTGSIAGIYLAKDCGQEWLLIFQPLFGGCVASLSFIACEKIASKYGNDD